MPCVANATAERVVRLPASPPRRPRLEVDLLDGRLDVHGRRELLDLLCSERSAKAPSAWVRETRPLPRAA